MSEIEILAPAGGNGQLLAAVRCGADAVYLGTESFNARRKAENFDGSALIEAVAYCHIRGVRVYVALNTLVFDNEISELYTEIENIAKSGADAVIVQDLAVMNSVKAVCPEMPLHASTQMAVHNVSGVKALQKLGFKRAVLARELSFDEIKAIRQSTDIELECFVHGAHCMSVSGLCYMSAVLGGRSANRGLCAQPCRLNINAGGREYALSLKDLSLIDKIGELRGAGVSSVKIEGRMKRPEYAAAAVTACKNAAAGLPYDRQKLKDVFSRSGFTDGYFTARRDLSMFGIRSKEDVKAAGKAQKELEKLYEKEKGSVQVNANLQIKKGENAALCVWTKGESVFVTGDKPIETEGKALSKEDAYRFLSKTGGTPFILKNAKILLDAGITMSSAQINALRRSALSELEKKLSATPKNVKAAPPPEMKTREFDKAPEIRIRVGRLSQLPESVDAEYIYVPIDELLGAPERTKKLAQKLIAELPALLFPESERKIKDALGKLKTLGVERAAANNIGAISLIKEAGLEAHGQSGLNIVNSLSLYEYGKMDLCDTELSFELAFNKMKKLKGETRRGFIGYGYLPLMRFRVCPVKPSLGCRACSEPVLKDSKNISFKLLCRDGEYMTLLNSVPLYVGDAKTPGADFVTLYFTVEDKRRISEICDMYKKGGKFDGERTRGLYFREIL